MRALLISVAFVCFSHPAWATPQLRDKVYLGNQHFYVEEVPMLGLWDYSGGAPAKGKRKPPEFESESSANHVGYQAEFEIRDAKFWLRKIAGRINGKKQTNEQIIPDDKFPIVAEWFSGRIHLPLGEFDSDTQEYRLVVICHIEKGIVTRTDFADRLRRVGTWNGLSQRQVEHQATITIDGIGAVPLPPGRWLLERVSNHQNHDIYMFEKMGARLERLSFQVLKGDLAKSVDKHLASLSEGVVNGIPRGVLKAGEDGPGTAQTIRPTVNVREHCLAASHLYTAENGDPWLNHTLVCNWKDGVLVCVHASEHAISPDVLNNVYSKMKASLAN